MSDLPTGSEPLTLADGRVIMPNGKVLRNKEPSPVAVTVVTEAEVQPKKLDDLPDRPRVMNAVCLVLAYKLFGLSDEDTANAVGTTVERVKRIVASDAYGDMRRAVVRGVLDGEAGSVRNLFQHYSRDAVGTLVETLKEGKRADRLTAARDILDRAGHRPADVVEHRLRMEGGLTIEVVRRDGNTDVPTINMEDYDG
jgi:hypothetical protein